MSVETFHFCAHRERVAHWWQMPMRELWLEMEEFQETDDSYLASFLVPDLMRLSVLLPLVNLRERNSDALSPHALLRQTLDEIIQEQSRPIPHRFLSVFHPSERAARGAIVAQVRELLELYRGLHEVAHVGPYSEEIDLRGYNLLVERLQGVLPQEEAELYHEGTNLYTLGELVPHEFAESLNHLPEELQIYTGATSVVDAQMCLQAWSNLDNMSHFWDDWEATPDGEQLVPHFRAISQVAQYALQHNAVMLQVIT